VYNQWENQSETIFGGGKKSSERWRDQKGDRPVKTAKKENNPARTGENTGKETQLLGSEAREAKSWDQQLYYAPPD